jgi:acyl dehydratase
MTPTGKEHRFELVEVGEEFGPLAVTVDEARVKAFAYAQDDYGPWHSGPSPFGAPVAHPSLLANDLMQVYFDAYRIDVHEASRGDEGAWLEEAHVEETLWFDQPLPVGETVAVSGRFVDKYVVRGRGAVVLEGEARTGDGGTVLRHRAIEYFRMDRERPDDERRGEPLRPVDAEAEGERLPVLEKRITFPQVLVYSSVGHKSALRSIHTDFEIAARAGLSAPLVQGQQLACYMAEACEQRVGSSWYRGGMLRTKFLRPVCAGQTVRVSGTVRWSGEGLEIDLWAADESGALVAVGNASSTDPSKRPDE